MLGMSTVHDEGSEAKDMYEDGNVESGVQRERGGGGWESNAESYI